MARRSVEAEAGGTVSKIELREGQHVAREQLIMTIELMKMEIAVTAPVDGTVSQILVAEGDTVAEGQEVAIIETP
jgi:biotin carboxyl carrier protein